ncbi:hypothetical protein [Microseira sp. BLCC-F43]|jgi:hypothetical protein|uniref:hypothetical protein n=1 Tax=Microseira sp. BLCC-F43 TaxID=3153602 RepID=UPI0035B91648
MNSLKLLHNPKYWLVGIAVSLIAIHLTLVSKTAPTFFLGTSILFWLAVASRIWEKRDTLSLKSEKFSSFLGATIIICFKLTHKLSSSDRNFNSFKLN